MDKKIWNFQEYERFLKWKLESVNIDIIEFVLKINGNNNSINNKEILNLKQTISNKPFYNERIKTLNCNEKTNFFDFILDDISNYENENIDIYNEIINMIEFDLNNQDEYGLTLLHKAITDKNINKLKRLIMLGANLDIKNNKGRTPLYFAVKKVNVEFVKILIENKCIIDNNILDFLKNREPINITLGDYYMRDTIRKRESDFYLINNIIINYHKKNINFEIKKYNKMPKIENGNDALEYFKNEINSLDLQDTSSLPQYKPSIRKM